MRKMLSRFFRSILLVVFIWGVYAPLGAAHAARPTNPIADVSQIPHAAACGTVLIQDNIVAASSAAVFTFYYDISPQNNVAGMYIGYSITNTAATASPDIWIKLDTFSSNTVILAPGEDGIVHLGSLGPNESRPVYFYMVINGLPGDVPNLNETFQVNLYHTDPSVGGEICDYTDTINDVDKTIGANSNKVVTSVATANPPTIGSLMTITVVGETGTIGDALIFKASPASVNTWPAEVFKMTGVHIDYWNNITCPSAGGVPSGAPTNQFDKVLVFTTPSVKNSCYRIVYSFVINGTTAAPTSVEPSNEISSGTAMKHTGAYTNPILPIQSPENSTVLSKSASPDAFPPSTDVSLTYTVTLSNSSAYAVTLEEFYDTLPAGTTYISGSSAYFGSAVADPLVTGQTLRWIGTFNVPANGSRTLTYRAQRSTSYGTFTNSIYGKIGSVKIDSTLNTADNANATSSYTVSAPAPALSIDKTSTTANYDAAGDVLSYSYTLTNTGNVPLSGPFTVADDKATDESCPVLASLPPAQTLICTASYTVTQTDVNAGSVKNTAYAQGNFSGTPVTSATDSFTINAVQNPELTLDKTAAESSYDAVGDVLNYSYEVTNSGNTTLYGITVTDDKASVTCPDTTGGVAPGGKVTCTASYSIKQGDLDAGSVTNSAYASDGTTDSAPDAVTVYAVTTPGMTLDKTAAESSYDAVGDVLNYSYEVTNSGNNTLYGITVTDNKTSVSCPDTSAGLAPGGKVTCTASYSIKQGDLDAGSVTNTAYASDGTTDSATDTVTVNAVTSPGMTLDKTAAESSYDAVGDELNYSYEVTNSGNTTLYGITVTDDKTSVSCPDTSAGLAPGGKVTCTASYSIKQGDLDAGSVTNSAYASDGTTDSATDAVTVNAVTTPGMTLDKTAAESSYDAVGDELNYSYEVTNSGNTTLYGITVTDDKTSVSCPDTSAGLAPGGKVTCTASYSIKQGDLDAGSVTNTAYASDGTTDSATDTVTVNAVTSPGMTLDKTAAESSYDAVGDELNYSYEVTNSGNTTLYGITVTDDKTSVSCPDTSAGLAPGGKVTCTASYSIKQGDLDAGSVTNTAYASDGTTDSATDAVTVNAATGTLRVVKVVVNDNGGTMTASDFSFSVNGGGAVSFEADGQNDLTVGAGTYSVTETPPVGYSVSYNNCTNVAVPQNGTTTCTITNDDQPATLIVRKVVVNDNGGSLSPEDFNFSVNGGAAITFAADGENQLSINAGTYSVSESSPAGYTASYSNCTNITIASGGSATCTITNDDIAPSLTLVKTVTNNDSGTANAGAWTLSAAGPTPFSGSMSGAGYTVPVVSGAGFDAGTYTLAESGGPAGYTAGSWNCADGAGVPVTMVSSQVSIGLDEDITCTINNNDNSVGSIAVDKTSTAASVTAAGQVIPYSISVTNGGTVPLSSVTVNDPKCDAAPVYDSGDVNGDLLMQPTETWIYTCSRTVTQAEMDQGGYLSNTVIADSGESDPVEDVLNIPITQNPAITLTKTGALDQTVVDPDAESNPGDLIRYTFEAENTGNVSLVEDIVITDAKINPAAPNTVCTIVLSDAFEVGEKASCTADYTLTAGDISDGSVNNEAGAATTYDDDGDPATLPVNVTASGGTTTSVSAAPALELEKTAAPVTFTQIGDVINYTYTLRNAGNVNLYPYPGYSVIDSLISVLNCPAALPTDVLLPGGTMTCTATYTITGGDVSAGLVTNEAYARMASVPDCVESEGCVAPWVSSADDATVTLYNKPASGETGRVASAAKLLPATGFAPGVVTLLNTRNKISYAATEMTLEIPTLGVKIPITGVPFENDGWNVDWLWKQAGWLEGTAFPTSSGNSVITSHVYLPSGKPGPFVEITALRWGDQILIRNGDATYTYEVRSVKRVKPESVASVMKHETLSWITLLTCQGYDAEENSYDYRTAVRAVLISVK